LEAELAKGPREEELRLEALHRERKADEVLDQERVHDRPRFGAVAEQLELRRERRLGDASAHPVGEGGERIRHFPFEVFRGLPGGGGTADRPRDGIEREKECAEHLSDSPRAEPAQEIHLPQPVARHHPAEGPVHVDAPFGDEVRDAESVAEDAHGPGKASDRPGLGHAAGYQIGVEFGIACRTRPRSRRQARSRTSARRSAGSSRRFAHVSSSGTRTTLPPASAAIVPPPSSRMSTAAAPSLLARMRSRAVGVPPRWMWPRTPTRGSSCVNRRTSSARRKTRPGSPRSATTTMLLRLPRCQLWRTSAARARPSLVRNSWLREVPAIVPPRCRMLATPARVSGWSSPASRPAYPRRMPITSSFRPRAWRTTARIAAFIPGASPPLVRTPIRRMGSL